MHSTSLPSESADSLAFPILVPTVQIGFYQRLTQAQAEYLLPALLRHVATLDIRRVDGELHSYCGEDKLRHLANSGLRGELVFPVPYVLTSRPSLIAYYRLLLGFSRKEFYRPPFSVFSGMESRGRLTVKTASFLSGLCVSLIESAWLLANGIPTLSQDVLNALTLLTLGGQLRGGYNTVLGQNATKRVFELIRELVKGAVQEEDSSSIVLRNAAGRTVRIEFAPDPDIAVREQLGSGRFNNRIAIEIKGGTDVSNVHNRLVLQP